MLGRNVYYMHIPLRVITEKRVDNVLIPKVVKFNGKEYKVTKLIDTGAVPLPGDKHPVRRYTVEFSGKRKELIYDVKLRAWYSLKEITEKEARAIKGARGRGYPPEYFRSVIEARCYIPVIREEKEPWD